MDPQPRSQAGTALCARGAVAQTLEFSAWSAQGEFRRNLGQHAKQEEPSTGCCIQWGLSTSYSNSKRLGSGEAADAGALIIAQRGADALGAPAADQQALDLARAGASNMTDPPHQRRAVTAVLLNVAAIVERADEGILPAVRRWERHGVRGV